MTDSVGKQQVKFKIGDTIVHWTYGLGTVVGIDEKYIAGEALQFYVVEVEKLNIWVPVDGVDGSSIRFPIESGQFLALFDILRGPGDLLPENQYQRRLDLRGRMQKRTLEGLCHVIRDLKDRSRLHPLNQNDSAVFFRAEEHLLDEWVLSLGAERSNALRELDVLLQ